MDISSEQMALAVGTRLGRTQLRVDAQTAFSPVCPLVPPRYEIGAPGRSIDGK
jgi:hypothetical protein